ELSATLYAGVLSLVAGLAWTFRVYFTSLGDPFIIAVCSAVVGACLYYCFTRAAPYAHGEVESADLALDYVLYLACLVLSAELTYAAVVAAVGLTLHEQRVKPHFLDAYLHVAAIVAFAAVVSGVRDPSLGALYTLALTGMTAAAVVLGVRHSRFAFVAYGIVY